MHAPDGFLSLGTAVTTAVLGTAAVGIALRQSSRQLSDRQIPVAGLTGAFVFAAQMVSFPVAAGTSGHLLGGLLAAVLLGPATGALVVATVIVLQALIFADGGITAIGYNVLNMAVVTSFGGYAAYLGFRRLLPRNSSGVVMASGLAAGASVVLGAMAFSVEWLFGATAPVSFDTVFGSMVAVHLLIGIGEGVITAAAVSAVLAVRPDLVFGAADLDRLAATEKPRWSGRGAAIAAVLVVLAMAGVVSQFASSSPDGLSRVATDHGIEGSASAADGSLFAGYATEGIGHESLSLAIAGLAGAALTALIGVGILSSARLSRPQSLVGRADGPAEGPGAGRVPPTVVDLRRRSMEAYLEHLYGEFGGRPVAEVEPAVRTVFRDIGVVATDADVRRNAEMISAMQPRAPIA